MDFYELINNVNDSNMTEAAKETLYPILLRLIPDGPIVHATYPDEDGDLYIECSCPRCDADCSTGMIDDDLPGSPLNFFCNGCGQSLRITFTDETKPRLEKEDNVIFMFGKPKEE
jgi:hypothetical protein